MPDLKSRIDALRALPDDERDALRGRVDVLIPTGLGLNCEIETEAAFRMAGARPERVHLLDLLSGEHPRSIDDYPVLAFVGGFAFGDHLGAGFVFANKIRHRLSDALGRFLDRGGLAFGVCNGFQTMVRLGMLPGMDGEYRRPRATLAPNARLGYRDAWVRVGFETDSPCLWTHGLDRLDLPARHGEGRFIVESDALHERMRAGGQLVARYLDERGRPTERWPDNPNGSRDGVAGVCDPSGRLFGLMPHPDAFLYPFQHPQWRRRRAAGDRLPEEGGGVAIFRNGVDAAVCRRAFAATP